MTKSKSITNRKKTEGPRFRFCVSWKDEHGDEHEFFPHEVPESEWPPDAAAAMERLYCKGAGITTDAFFKWLDECLEASTAMFNALPDAQRQGLFDLWVEYVWLKTPTPAQIEEFEQKLVALFTSGVGSEAQLSVAE
ncbi:MAG: hypothetical protein ACJ74W_13315 [Pyrinomonadaceae bacterium]